METETEGGRGRWEREREREREMGRERRVGKASEIAGDRYKRKCACTLKSKTLLDDALSFSVYLRVRLTL